MTDQRQLPADLHALLDGEHLDQKVGHVFELLTVAPDGWPHVALLSVGEVLWLAPSRLGLALWPSSTTSSNLRRDGRAVLQLYHGGAAYRARLACSPAGTGQVPDEGKLALFSAAIEEVTRDAVGYARLTSGPQIELTDIDRVVGRWQVQLQRLREAASAA